jgi:hypothetical protein
VGLELALDDHVGFLEAGLDVAQGDLHPLGDVGGRARLGLDAGRVEVLVQERGVGPHGLDHIDDVGEHRVLHVDQLEGAPGNGRGGRRHGGHGMALVEDLLASYDVPHHVPVVHHHPIGRDELRGLVGKSPRVTMALTPAAPRPSSVIETMRAWG